MEKGIETRLFGTDFITKVLKESQKYPRPRRQNVSKEEMLEKDRGNELVLGNLNFLLLILDLTCFCSLDLATDHWLDWQRLGNRRLAEGAFTLSRKRSLEEVHYFPHQTQLILKLRCGYSLEFHNQKEMHVC